MRMAVATAVIVGMVMVMVVIMAMMGLAAGSRLAASVLLPGLAEDFHRRRQEQAGHDRGDGEVGPGGGGSPYAEGGDHDGDIADGVVPRAEPDRADVGVAILVAHQDQDARDIGGKRQEADDAHDL